MSQTRRLQFLAGHPRAFGGVAPRKSSNRNQKWLLPHHNAKYHVEYMLYISLYFTGEQHCAMEQDYFGSFKQSRWLSIFVVHEIQLRPRCIMESVNGSLMLEIEWDYFNSASPSVWRLQFFHLNISDFCNRTTPFLSIRVRFFGKIQIRILVSKNEFCISLPKSENGLIKD